MHEAELFWTFPPAKWRTHDDSERNIHSKCSGIAATTCVGLLGGCHAETPVRYLRRWIGATFPGIHSPANLLKLLAKFGLIPGAALGLDEEALSEEAAGSSFSGLAVYRCNGADRDRCISRARGQYWVELTYTYFVEEYRRGSTCIDSAKKMRPMSFCGRSRTSGFRCGITRPSRMSPRFWIATWRWWCC
jgi:hypothetical protein